MTAQDILKELEPLGQASYRKVIAKHGVPEPMFGVKIEELKKIEKRIRRDYRLALELWETGVYDAMYLAGLIADAPRMSRKDLQRWAETSTCPMLSEYTVAWTAAESPHGPDLALAWIDSKKERVASSGWATLGSLVAIRDDADLDLAQLKGLLERVQKTIHQQPNRVRYVMNGFVIAAGCHVKPLNALALRTGERIGKVTVEMGDTDCKLPSALDAIGKVEKRGGIGKKRKTAKC